MPDIPRCDVESCCDDFGGLVAGSNLSHVVFGEFAVPAVFTLLSVPVDLESGCVGHALLLQFRLPALRPVAL